MKDLSLAVDLQGQQAAASHGPGIAEDGFAGELSSHLPSRAADGRDTDAAALPQEDAQLVAFMNAPDAGPAQLVQERRFRSLLALVPPEERAQALAALQAIDRHWPGLGVGFPSSRLDRG